MSAYSNQATPTAVAVYSIDYTSLEAKYLFHIWKAPGEYGMFECSSQIFHNLETPSTFTPPTNFTTQSCTGTCTCYHVCECVCVYVCVCVCVCVVYVTKERLTFCYMPMPYSSMLVQCSLHDVHIICAG